MLLPVLHLGALGANVAAVSLWPYQWLLVAQVAFYMAALAGAVQRHERYRNTLCLLCWADVVGFYRFVTNRQPVTWERAPFAVPATGEQQSARGVAA